MKVYILKNDQQQGPYTVDEIKGFLRTGVMSGADKAWYEGASDWVLLASVPGIITDAYKKIEQGSRLRSEGKFQEAISLLKEGIATADFVEYRLGGIHDLLACWIKLYGFPKAGTLEHKEFYTYVKAGLQAYESAFPVMQERYQEFYVNFSEILANPIIMGIQKTCCGTIFQDDDIFCSICGKTITVSASENIDNKADGEALPKDLALLCRQCNIVAADGSKFCHNCGAVLAASEHVVQEKDTDQIQTLNTEKQAIRERVKNIVKHLNLTGVGELSEYKDTDDDLIEIKIINSPLKGEFYLRYEGNDKYLRITTKCIFGCLDPNEDISANQLLQLLYENIESFKGSSAYLGIKPFGDHFLVYLHAYHHFLSKWSDEDIAEALSLHIFDIMNSFIITGITSGYPKPIIVWQPD